MGMMGCAQKMDRGYEQHSKNNTGNCEYFFKKIVQLCIKTTVNDIHWKNGIVSPSFPQKS